MASISGLSVLNFSSNLQSIVIKLPVYLQNKWRDKVAYWHLQEREAQFSDLVDFLRVASLAANDPVFGKDGLAAVSRKSAPREKSFSVAVDPCPPKKLRCWLCQGAHHLDDCTAFRDKSLSERKRFIRDKKLCFACFGLGHFLQECKSRRKCMVCSQRHPTSLHSDGNSSPPESVSTQSSSCHDEGEGGSVMHAILPVRVSLNGKTITTCAFFDNGSSASFVTDDVIEKLGAKGATVALRLTTMHGVNARESRLIKNFVVSDMNEENPVTVNRAYSTDSIPSCGFRSCSKTRYSEEECKFGWICSSHSEHSKWLGCWSVNWSKLPKSA